MSHRYSNRSTSGPPSTTDFKCVGYAPHGKAGDGSCSNPILKANRYQVIQALDRIRSVTLSSRELTQELEYMAELALCKRWHRGQACDVAAYWKASFFAPSRTDHVRREPRPRHRNPEHASEWQATYSMDRREPAIAVPPPTPPAQLASPRTSAAVPRNSSQGIQLSPVPSSTPNPEPMSPASVASAAANIPPPVIPHSASSHDATRRTLTSTSICLICHEPLAATEALTWCKTGCGQNFHASCWSSWVDFRSQNPHVGPLWCCYCRAEWVRELCGCDDVAPEVEIESTSEEVDPPSERAVEIEPADEEAPGVYTALPGVSEQLEGDPVDAYTLGPSLEASEPWSSVSESSDAQGHGVFYYLLRPWRIVDRVRASSIAEWLRGRWIRSRLFRVLLWLFERSIVE